MNSALVAYVLSKVAKVADVNPRDIHTSVRGGSIVLNNVVLRKDTMNKLLPVPVERGEALALAIQIPNPTTSNPLRVELKGAHLTLAMELAFPPAERTMEEILQDITDTTILGGVAASTAAEGTVAADHSATVVDGEGDECLRAAVAVSPSQRSDALERMSQHSERDKDMVSAYSGEEREEDLLSCRSDDATEADSLAADDDDDGGGEGVQQLGWFAYFREKAAKSMEWIWQRQMEIVFTDLEVTLPCDARQNSQFELKAAEFSVTVKPAQSMGAQQLKVTSITVRDAAIIAKGSSTAAPSPTVMSFHKVVVVITKVYATRGNALLRSNVAVSFPGVVSITADEDTLHALVRCKATRDIVMALPPYCRPYANLRKEPSLWPYVASCVLAKVRDQRQRYNFSLAHIRLFARSRERYLRLLGECHRARSVARQRQELAETEQDLRYTDVILALRQMVQRRYAAQPSVALGASDADGKAATKRRRDPAESPSLSGVRVTSSTHFHWEEVRLALPANTVVEVRAVSAIVRDYETTLTVDDIVLHSKQHVQHIKGPPPAAVGAAQAVTEADRSRGRRGEGGEAPAAAGDGDRRDRRDRDEESGAVWASPNGIAADGAGEAAPLLCFRRRTAIEEKGGGVETRIEFAELSLQLRLHAVHAVAVPLLEVLSQIGLKERVPTAAVESLADTARAEAARVSQSFIGVIPRMTWRFDALTMLLDHLAVTATTVVAAGQPPVFPKYGCTLKELSIRDGDGAYLLSPLGVRMRDSSDEIAVSPVQLAVSASSWCFMRGVCERTQDLIQRIPPQLLAKQAKLAAATASASAADEASLTFAVLEGYKDNLPLWRDIPRGAQSLTVAGVRATFEPLELSVSVSRVQVNRTTAREGLRPTPQSMVVRTAVGGAGVGTRRAVAPVESRASFERSHGLHLRVNYAGATLSYTKRLSLAVSVNDGIDLFMGTGSHPHGPSSGPRTTAMAVRVPSVVVAYGPYRSKTVTEGSTAHLDVKLLELGGVSGAMVDAYTYIFVERVKAMNEGVVIAPLEVLARRDTLAVMSTERPYRASFLQLSCALAEVSLRRVLAVDYGALGAVVGPLSAFAMSEFLPTSVYRLFFSGYADVAARVATADPGGCRVSWGGTEQPPAPSGRRGSSDGSLSGSPVEALRLSLGPRSPSSGTSQASEALRSFGVLLPSLLSGVPPLVMTNTLKSLSFVVECPWMRLAVGPEPRDALTTITTTTTTTGESSASAAAAVTAEAAVVVKGLTLRMPLDRMDFWAADVRAIAVCPVKAAVAHVRADIISREVGLGVGVCGDGSGVARSEDAPRTLASLDLAGLSFESFVHTALRESPASAKGPCSGGGSRPIFPPTLDPQGTQNPRRGHNSQDRSGDFLGGLPNAGGDDQVHSLGSESDSASCASFEEEQKSSVVRIRAWSAAVSFAHGAAHYSAAQSLVSSFHDMLANAGTSSSRGCTKITSSLACRHFDFTHGGCLYVDGASGPYELVRRDESLGILVLESCSFAWPFPDTTSRIVVCPNTSVIFKDCVFKRPRSDLHAGAAPFAYVCSADPATGLFAFINCAEADTTEVKQSSVSALWPASLAAPQPPPPPPASSAPAQHLLLTLPSGSLTVQLNQTTSLVMGQGLLSANVTLQQSIRALRVHSAGVRFDLERKQPRRRRAVGHTEADSAAAAATTTATTSICPKVTLDVDVSERRRSDSFVLNCSVGVGEVYIPLILDALEAPMAVVHQISERLRPTTKAAGGGMGGEGYARDRDGALAPSPLPSVASSSQCLQSSAGESAGPVVTAVLPYSVWKLLCSISLTPIRVGTPDGGLTIAQVTVSNGFLWSHREAADAEAQFEGRLALHDMAVWQFSSRSLRGISAHPCFLGLQGRLSPDMLCTLQGTASCGEVTLTSSQLRLLTSVAACGVGALESARRRGASAAGRGVPPVPYAARVTNDSGERLLLSCTTAASSGEAGGDDCSHGGASTSSMPLRRRTASSRSLRSLRSLGTTAASAARPTVKVDGCGTVTLPRRSGGSAGDGGAPAVLPSAGTGQLILGRDTSAFAAEASTASLASPRVELASRTSMMSYGLDTSAIAAEAHYVTLPDGNVLHVVAALCTSPSLELFQEVYIRTTFQIVNETPFSLRFTSRYTQVQHVVPGHATGSIPLGLLGCPDINVAIQQTLRKSEGSDNDNDNENDNGDDSEESGEVVTSLRERLWADDTTVPMQVLRHALEDGTPPGSLRRAFVSQKDGSRVYLVFEFAVQGRVIVVFVRSRQPSIQNATCLPLLLEVSAAPSSSSYAASSSPVRLGPGEEAFFYSLNPAVLHSVRVHVDVHGETFTTDVEHASSAAFFPARGSAAGDVDDDDDADADGADAVGRRATLLARHEKQPRRFSFELGGVQVLRTVGCRSRVWVLAAPKMALLHNRSDVDVAITSAASDTSAGSLGLAGLPSRSFGYVPLSEDLFLRAKGTKASDAFQLESGYTGGLVLCEPAGGPGASASASLADGCTMATFFLIRPLAPSSRSARTPPVPRSPDFELLPPLLLANEGGRDSVLVLHSVYPVGGERSSGGGGGRRWASQTQHPFEFVEVPPSAQVSRHRLSQSGCTNAFFFSCDDGRSFSEAVETDLLPGTNWHGRVHCSWHATRKATSAGSSPSPPPAFTHQHRVRITKKGLCDPAVVAVGPAEPLAERMVNFTNVAFAEVGPLSVQCYSCGGGVGDQTPLERLLAASEECAGNEFVLDTSTTMHLPALRSLALHSEDTGATVQVALVAGEPSVQTHPMTGPTGPASEGALVAHVVSDLPDSHGHFLSVVLVDRDVVFVGPRLLAGQLTDAAAPAEGQRALKDHCPLLRSPTPFLFQTLVVRAELQVSRQSLRLLDTAGFSVRVSMDSAAAWINYASSALTVQCSAKGISVDNTPTAAGTAAADSPGRQRCTPPPQRYALHPFSVDLAVRDAQITPTTLSIQSLRANCAPLTITVSDLLIIQMVRLAKQCAPAASTVPIPMDQRSSSAPASPRTNRLSPTEDVDVPYRILIATATLSEVPIVVSWDRSAASNAGADATVDYEPEEESNRILGFAAFIPSLHHATLTLPKMQFIDLSSASPAELSAMIQQIVFMEVIKQIPRMVSTVRLFPQSMSFLDHLASRVTSFFFLGDSDSKRPPDDDGNAALL